MLNWHIFSAIISFIAPLWASVWPHLVLWIHKIISLHTHANTNTDTYIQRSIYMQFTFSKCDINDLFTMRNRSNAKYQIPYCAKRKKKHISNTKHKYIWYLVSIYQNNITIDILFYHMASLILFKILHHLHWHIKMHGSLYLCIPTRETVRVRKTL